MTYTLGIPADGQSLGNSKPQVRGNFTTIFNAFAVNHVALNSSPQGKHFFVEMPDVSDQATTTNEIGLYCKKAGSPAYSNLFFRQEIGGADPTKNQGAIIQMTNIAPVNASSGYSFLPGGMLIQWDTITTNGTNSTPVVFPIAFDVATTPYSIQLTGAVGIIGSNLSLSVSGATNAGFNLRTAASATLPVYYTAIGQRTT